MKVFYLTKHCATYAVCRPRARIPCRVTAILMFQVAINFVARDQCNYKFILRYF
jgi:hypothetical protein